MCDGTSAVGESRHRIPGASVGQPTEPCLAVRRVFEASEEGRAAAASGIGWAWLLPDSVEVRLILDRRSASRRCGRASGAAAGIAERGRAVAIAGGRAGRAARAVTECLGAVAVSAHRAGDPAVGIAERGFCADAAVASTSRTAAQRVVSFIGRSPRWSVGGGPNSRKAGNSAGRRMAARHRASG